MRLDLTSSPATPPPKQHGEARTDQENQHHPISRQCRTALLRPLEQDDYDRLLAFFHALPEEDCLFLRHDVRDPNLIRKWTTNFDFDRVLPLVAEEDGLIVADGTLHVSPHGWTRHVGQIRLVTARTHRHAGLGALIARELVALAEERGLDKPAKPGDTKVIRELTRIRKNLDVMLLFMHTMACIACGAVTALALYIQQTGLMVGAGGTFGFRVMTLLTKLVTPSGNLKDIVNSDQLMKQLLTLSQQELAKLMQKAQETGYLGS